MATKKKPAKKKPVKSKAKKKPAKPAKKAAKKPAKAAPMPPEGSVIWMGLNTHDKAAAARFYREVLRLQHRIVPIGKEGSMMVLSAGKTDIAHVSDMMDGQSPRWMAFFYAKDVDGAAAMAVKSGGTIQIPPTDIPEGRFCVLLDPQGVEFAVYRPA